MLPLLHSSLLVQAILAKDNERFSLDIFCFKDPLPDAMTTLAPYVGTTQIIHGAVLVQLPVASEVMVDWACRKLSVVNIK
jgi:hypothetical protein